ncbi:hypothetical protein PoB_002679400 [Plakobranchus ocellatus]|uniref:Uncharacterized protein n=1 Tax=Plakobranchus ocellatus TaxID=259542 RepID=A0AAV3ZYA8_9GAST|nr:hypothetical protein PoB_002679400 [Plakobranchus ocellatus]
MRRNYRNFCTEISKPSQRMQQGSRREESRELQQSREIEGEKDQRMIQVMDGLSCDDLWPRQQPEMDDRHFFNFTCTHYKVWNLGTSVKHSTYISQHGENVCETYTSLKVTIVTSIYTFRATNDIQLNMQPFVRVCSSNRQNNQCGPWGSSRSRNSSSSGIYRVSISSASPQKGNLNLSGPLSSQGAGGGLEPATEDSLQISALLTRLGPYPTCLDRATRVSGASGLVRPRGRPSHTSPWLLVSEQLTHKGHDCGWFAPGEEPT